MLTLGVAIVLLAILMIYCGIESKSLRHTLIGQSVDAGSGGLLKTAGAG